MLDGGCRKARICPWLRLVRVVRTTSGASRNAPTDDELRSVVVVVGTAVFVDGFVAIDVVDEDNGGDTKVVAESRVPGD